MPAARAAFRASAALIAAPSSLYHQRQRAGAGDAAAEFRLEDRVVDGRKITEHVADAGGKASMALRSNFLRGLAPDASNAESETDCRIM
jgi:hypothetical protein